LSGHDIERMTIGPELKRLDFSLDETGLQQLPQVPWARQIEDLEVHVACDHPTREDFRGWQQLTRLKSLVISGQLTMDQLASLGQHCPAAETVRVELHNLKLGDCQVFAEIKCLTSLSLSGCSLNDAGLAGLRTASLRELDLSHIPLDGSGLVHLPHRQLNRLHLRYTNVSAAAVDQFLAENPQLKYLNLKKSAVTLTEADSLQLRYPGCTIVGSDQ